MSRTYKDRPARINYPEEQWNYRYGTQDPMDVLYFRHLERASIIKKKKKNVDTNHHWMTTPSWWTRLTMNRPQRRNSKMWETKVVGKKPTELDTKIPQSSVKNHTYTIGKFGQLVRVDDATILTRWISPQVRILHCLPNYSDSYSLVVFMLWEHVAGVQISHRRPLKYLGLLSVRSDGSPWK